MTFLQGAQAWVEAQAQAQGREHVDAKNAAPAKPVVVVTHAAKRVGQASHAAREVHLKA
jgi:hypothetical protein